jgi:hypothetical protein
VQEPLDNLSEQARRVHAYLEGDPDRTEHLEGIAEAVGLSEGDTANALRELEAGKRAVETFGGWSVLTGGGMRLIVEKVTGPGEYERVGEVRVTGKNVVADALNSLGVTEVASYRAYPVGFEQDAGFWRLNMDGTVEQQDVPGY